MCTNLPFHRQPLRNRSSALGAYTSSAPPIAINTRSLCCRSASPRFSTFTRLRLTRCPPSSNEIFRPSLLYAAPGSAIYTTSGASQSWPLQTGRKHSVGRLHRCTIFFRSSPALAGLLYVLSIIVPMNDVLLTS